MDLKLKGKSWAGDIYHRFESICQDVDDFMGKDTLKFVENQVQSVGTSVKRFYSNVVQDIIPLSGDIMKPEAQSVDGEQDEKQDRVNSITDSPEQAETDLHVRDDGDSIIWNDADNGIKEKITRDAMPLTISSSFHSQFFPGMSNEDHKNSTLTMTSSPAFSCHEEGLVVINNGKMDYNHQNGKTAFPDHAQCLSLLSSTGLLENKPPIAEDPGNRSSSAPPVGSSYKVDEDNNALMDSPLPSTCDAVPRAMTKDRTLCDSFSTKDKSFNVSSSVQSPECVYSYILHDQEEMGVMSSPYSTPPKSSVSTSPNFIKNAVNISSCAESNISTLSSTIESYETKAADMLQPFLESNGSAGPTSSLADNNIFLNDGSDFIVRPPESRLKEQHKDFRSETGISQSKTGNAYEFKVEGDLNMETIDLNPDMNHDAESVALNVNSVHAASHRRRNFRYYKKLIQDAFTSRNRLSKEYEHLAILYGDIDMESSQNFEPRSVPFSSNTSVHAVRTLSSQEMCETDWELL